jgi:hypothetical protein
LVGTTFKENNIKKYSDKKRTIDMFKEKDPLGITALFVV